MKLKLRLKKLEANCRQGIIVYVPDDIQGREREAFIEAYRREKHVPREVRILALDESDRDA